MSYFSLPRLVFAGKFHADPSTVNNDPEHYDTSRFRSDYLERRPGKAAGLWNPVGTGAFRLSDCVVQRVVYGDGGECADPRSDPIVGAPVVSGEGRVAAKIVDLDPEQQLCSEIWGLTVSVGRPGCGLRGEMRVAASADFWPSRVVSGVGDTCASAFWQSVLEGLGYLGDGGGGSRFLRELLALGPEALSIRLTVDGYDDDARSSSFTMGRVVGAVGPHVPGEPRHFVAGRRLQPSPEAWHAVNDAYAVIEGDMIHVDLSNSLVTTTPGGPFADVGHLAVALLAEGAPPAVEAWLAPVPYLDPSWYASSAGIVSARLSREQIEKAAERPLAVQRAGRDASTSTLLAEAPDGRWVRADGFVFRLNPGPGAYGPWTAEAVLHATRFGRRLPGAAIALDYDPSRMLAQATRGPEPGPRRLGEPRSALTFPVSIETGPDGTATLALTAGDPGNPREYIDGQVYGITYQLGASPPPRGSVGRSSLQINVRVWSGYEVPARPSWMRDVRPILQQYANLYPVMRSIVDLASYASITRRRDAMRIALRAPEADPNHMPVSRDLSAAKRTMLERWIECPLYMDLASGGDLRLALQQAIELEHAAIPPYLTALYSIKPGHNLAIAERLRGIVLEEMLHMGLVCNILVSIGGSPRLSHPAFVPSYPGPLPGGLRADLTVRLRRLSIAHVRDVFLPIEQPHVTVEEVAGDMEPGDPIDTSLFTVGWFYGKLVRSLTQLSRAGAIRFGQGKQVTGFGGRLFPIESLPDALRAIEMVRREGEGAGPLDPDDHEGELAHYYKFSEIVHGRRLSRIGARFAYDGEVVPFDAEGVYPMVDDPNQKRLDPGSRAAVVQQQFAETYHALLTGLERAFNGDPGYFGQTIGMMYSLDLAARQLMTTPVGDGGLTAGPSFQLPATP